jgi:hypothetical protein
VVNPSVTPLLTINSNDTDNSICANNPVTFTAIASNGGTSPIYQWQLNSTNVGTSSASYSNSSLASGDVVTCILTSNETCASSTSVTSNSVSTTVLPSVNPTIVINSDDVDNIICDGTSVNFSASVTNEGTNPVFQWFLNGNPVGSNSIFYSNNTLMDNDLVTCQLNSSELCASPSNLTSIGITTNVNANIDPSVTILSSDADNSICANESVTFTASVNNGGTAPNYQWKVNGLNVSTNSETFTSSTLVDGDIISCEITSNSTCASTNLASSNNITMEVIPTIIPSVNINSDDFDNEICTGTLVTFTANAINGGTPTYQWKLNGANVGTSNPLFSNSNLNDLDVISCQITSTALCASPTTVTSNAITVAVNPNLSPSISIVSDDSDNIIVTGATITFTATIGNGGNNPSFQWILNGSNVGTNSSIFTSSNLQNGDIVSCQLTSDETCLTAAAVMSNDLTISVSDPVGLQDIDYSNNQLIFPNPFQDGFSIKLDLDTDEKIEIRVFDISGKVIESLDVEGKKLSNLTFGSNFKAGMYHVSVKNGDKISLFKVVKQ